MSTMLIDVPQVGPDHVVVMMTTEQAAIVMSLVGACIYSLEPTSTLFDVLNTHTGIQELHYEWLERLTLASSYSEGACLDELVFKESGK